MMDNIDLTANLPDPLAVPANVTRTDHAAVPSPMFELRDVAFKVSDRVLLEPLTLQFEPRRVIGLIGHNGSGKSTLIKLLARQQAPAQGEIRFESKPLADWQGRALARKVAYLPQHTPSAAGLRVRELVRFGRYPWHGPLGRFGAVDRERVEEAMTLTGVDGFADRLVDTLSGGERQRVWLAMLVAQDADCLLLDEPISALDVAHQVEVLSLVQSLSRSRGLGVVVVLHDVNMAARFCDEIVALRGGRLCARGTPGELMTSERLQDIYGIPMVVMPHPHTGEPVCVVK